MFAAITVGAEVKSITWPTHHAAPPAKIDQKKDKLLPLIRLGVTALPESTVMQMTFVGGSILGLPEDKAKSLHKLLTDRYDAIEKDKIFSKTPSQLSHCYAANKNKTGLASVYLPDNPSPNTNVIVFLHGYGGSFIYYQHYLATAFPDHIIICPAYGISSASISGTYLKECYDATSKELGFKLKKPVLIGLSAGGFGGFREYAKHTQSYLGYICMAAYPPNDTLDNLPRDGRIRVIAGGDEDYVKNQTLKKSEVHLNLKVKDYTSHIVADEDHFFMLSAEEETQKHLQQWIKELQNEK